MPAYADDARLLAGGAEGAAALRSLTGVVLDALEEGAAQRIGPLPRGGPERVAGAVRAVLGTSGGGGEAGVVPERRRLLVEGRAVLGRADIVSASASGGERAGGSTELWLKATLLNPHARDSDLESLLKLVLDALPSSSASPFPDARSEAAPENGPAAAASTTVTATSAARSRRS